MNWKICHNFISFLLLDSTKNHSTLWDTRNILTELQTHTSTKLLGMLKTKVVILSIKNSFFVIWNVLLKLASHTPLHIFYRKIILTHASVLLRGEHLNYVENPKYSVFTDQNVSLFHTFRSLRQREYFPGIYENESE